MFETILFTKNNGKSPVIDFIASCDKRLQIKINNQLHYVKEYGLSFAIPNMKKIRHSPFWELRILGRDNIRIICVNTAPNQVVVLHIFKKKSQQISIKDLQEVKRRYKYLLTNDAL